MTIMVTPPGLQVREYLYDMRGSQGWSLREVARRLGASASHLSDCENGRRRPGIKLLRRWVSILGGDPVEVCELYERHIAEQAVFRWRRGERV